MDSNKFSNWLQVAPNIGILAGLILVGLQMQQNTDLLRMQLLKDEATSYLSTENTILVPDVNNISPSATITLPHLFEHG